MSPTPEATLCAAGALVTTDPRTDQAVPYVARGYTHPALAERTIVRLLPEALAEAEDLALSTMGLAGSTTAAVGFGQRVALGFPAWALINDPGNARHALALVKDLERTARRARTKPGAAKDEIEALVARLGASAPHFLPTFLEEVGRIFARLDNKAMAGQFFGKARTAERVHHLPIDEDRHREVFLEFAFAGALTVKALTEEARELPGRVSPAEAYQLFRRLSLERVKGGLPPYAGMAKDLRAMAKAAGLDAATEDTAVIGALLTAPATRRAVKGFWTAYAKAIAAAAQTNPEVTPALLSLFPDEADSELWVTTLRAAGAVEQAKAGGVDLTVWLGKLVDHHHATSWRYPEASPALEALVHELAPLVTAAGGTELALTSWRDLDLDVLDVLAEHGLSVTRPNMHRSAVDVTDHVRRSGNSRTLEHLAAAPQWTQQLRESITNSLHQQTRPHPQLTRDVTGEERIQQLAAYPGLRSTIRAMLSEAIAGAADSLSAYGRALDLAEALSSPAGLVMVGDLVADLPDPDVTALVAEVYNAGILDELGWDSYERVMADYQDPGKNRGPSVDNAWPHIVVSNAQRATVVSRDGVVLEHTVQPSTQYPLGKYSSPDYVSVGTDLLVYWSTDAADGNVGYWDSDPHDVFKIDAEWLPSWAESLPTGPTGRTFGHRDFHVGERGKPKSRTDGLAGDGTHVWVTKGSRHFHRTDQPPTRWQELDLATGAVGRASYPAFLTEIAARRGHTVHGDDSTLRPVEETYADNPLGWRAGTVGQCWYTDDAGVTWLERTDGVRAGRFPNPARVGRHEKLASASSQLLSLPGGALLLAAPQYLANALTGRVVGTTLTGGRIRFAAGTVDLIPPVQRHNLRVRHEPTSLRLRTVTAAQLQDLLTACVTAPRVGDTQAAPFTPAELHAFTALFPGSPDSLRAGILAIMHGAKREAAIGAWLREQAAKRLTPDPSTDEGAATEELDELSRLFQAVPAGLTSLAEHHYGEQRYYRRVDSTLTSVLGNILAAGDQLTSTPASTPAATPEPGSAAAPERTTAPTAPAAPAAKRSGGFLKKLLGLAQDALAPAEPAATAAPTTPASPTRPWVADEALWSDYLHSPAVLIALGLGAQTSADDRARLAWLLQTLAESGLAGRSPELTSVRVSAAASRTLRPGQLLASPDGRVLLLAEASQSYPQDETVTHFAALTQGAPDFTALGLDVLWRVPAEAPQRSAAELERAAELLRAAPAEVPVATAAEIAALVDATGMLPEEASYWLAGIPSPVSWQNLEPELVQRLGLTAGSAKLARDTFDSCTTTQKRTLLTALVPTTLTEPLRLGADTDALARAWTTQFGTPMPVAPELLRAGFAELKGISHPLTVLRWALSPNPTGSPEAWQLMNGLQACLWLAYTLPAEHPGRRLLPAKLLSLRASFGARSTPFTVGQDTTNAFRTSHGLPAMPRGAAATRKENPPPSHDVVGHFSVRYDFHRQYDDGAYDVITVDPARFSAADLPFLATISTDSGHGSNIHQLQTLFGPALDALVADLERESFAGTGSLPNPLVSAPDTVAAAQSALGLDEDAAVLFLQLLALPDPTNARVQKWNGWTPARRTKAGAVLEAAGLVVRAKRARAGRELFLDGGWITLRGASLPLEAWKTALYGLPPGDKPTLGMDLLLVNESLPRLFTRAWERYAGGDVPAYDQLTTGRRA